MTCDIASADHKRKFDTQHGTECNTEVGTELSLCSAQTASLGSETHWSRCTVRLHTMGRVGTLRTGHAGCNHLLQHIFCDFIFWILHNAHTLKNFKKKRGMSGTVWAIWDGKSAKIGYTQVLLGTRKKMSPNEEHFSDFSQYCRNLISALSTLESIF